MKKQELNIQGMTCGHCVMHVKKELAKVTGVVVEDVEIGKAKIQVDEAKVTRDMLSAAVTEAGYQLVSVQ